MIIKNWCNMTDTWLSQFCRFATHTQSQRASVLDPAPEAVETEAVASSSSRTTLETCFFGRDGDLSLGFQDFSNFVSGI